MSKTTKHMFSSFVTNIHSIENDRRRLRLALLVVLSVAFLSALPPPAKALDVSTQAINADDVWSELGITGRGVTVAVIDSGIYPAHSDFQGAIKATWNFPDNTTYVVDGDPPHGTPIAGIIAGRGIEDPSYKGVAPEASLVIVKITNGTDLDEAVRWVTSNKEAYDIKILNLSTLSPEAEHLIGQDGMSVYSEAVDEAIEQGIVVIASAGNKGPNLKTIEAPGDAFNVITVGSVNDGGTPNIDDDILSNSSSRGPTGDGRPKLDVVAPGVNITAPRVGGDYEAHSGTSYATPHVTGTVALMLQANPNLTPAQVKAILRQTARLNTHLSGLTVNERGHGIIDAYAAVQLALQLPQYPDMIDGAQMYDPWSVKTPSRELYATWKTWDNLTFNVNSPSTAFGIGISNVQYHFRDNWGATAFDFSLLNTLSATHVWLFDTYYSLGMDMNQYLFTGPRIWAKGPGYVLMWARYRIKIQHAYWFVEYSWRLHVDEIYLKLDFGLASPWSALIYIDPNVWDSTNYAYLPSTSEKVYYERTVLGDVALDIRDPDHTDYIQIDPLATDNSTMWMLKYGYFGNDPSSVQNYEYIYNRDIVVYYRAATTILQPDPGPTIHRKTNPLIDPNPTQDDAHSGGDAGNDFNTATTINFPAGYPGILCYSDPEDTNDWYKFNATSGKTIIANMTPPYGVDFNLELYDPNGNLRAGSYLGPGYTDSVSIITDVAGYWRIRIYIVSGEALYYFNIINPHGGGGGNPPNEPDSINPPDI